MWSLANKERPQWMFLGQRVFECLHYCWSRDRTGYERDSDRFEGLRWKTLGCQSSPEGMPVASYCRKSSNSVVPDEIIDFTALNIGRAVVSSTSTRIEACVSGAWPAIGQPTWRVFYRNASLPDFPGRFRFLQTFQEPRFLFCP